MPYPQAKAIDQIPALCPLQSAIDKPACYQNGERESCGEWNEHFQAETNNFSYINGDIVFLW